MNAWAITSRPSETELVAQSCPCPAPSVRHSSEEENSVFMQRTAVTLAVLLLSGFVGSGIARATISFLPPVTLTKAGAAEMKAADMDGDGKIDLVVAGTDGVSILYGRGDGSFGERVDISL